MYMGKAGCTILHPTLNISVGLQMKRIKAKANSKQQEFYYQQNHQTTQVTAIRTHVISLYLVTYPIVILPPSSHVQNHNVSQNRIFHLCKEHFFSIKHISMQPELLS